MEFTICHKVRLWESEIFCQKCDKNKAISMYITLEWWLLDKKNLIVNIMNHAT